MMLQVEIARLKEEAATFSARQKYAQALEAYTALERLQPLDANWSKRVGEMLRRLGREHEAVAAWTRASERFAQAGFLIKAIAVCHLILRHEPENTEAKRRLAAFNEQQVRTPAKIGLRPIGQPAAPTATPGGMPLVDAGIEAEADDPSEPASEPSAASSIAEIPIVWEEAPEDAPARDKARAGRAKEATQLTLTRTPLFSDLPATSLERLIERIELVEVAAGEVIFREGDAGDALYVVAEGTVSISSAEATRPLAELGESEFSARSRWWSMSRAPRRSRRSSRRSFCACAAT